jgi:hypothetical protein
MPGRTENPFSSQINEASADKGYQEYVGGPFIAEREPHQVAQWLPEQCQRQKPEEHSANVRGPAGEPSGTLRFSPPDGVYCRHSIDNKDDRAPPLR